MHDSVQLMGQDIVRRECPNDPGKRSRLWCYDDVFEVLSEDMGTNAVKGIVLDLPILEELDISPTAFTHMRRLKVLIILNAESSGGPVCLPNDLRWLEWPGCPLSSLNFSANLKKLVCFDVHNSRIKEFGGNLKGFENMKFINLSECQLLVCMLNLSYTPNLEKLDLHGCKNLEFAHESIAYHHKLWYLKLNGCSKLERFPEIPGKNKSLRELWLGGTSIEELPASIENLVSLDKIDLENCKKLIILPSSIYRLQNLEWLFLKGSSKLIKFPKEDKDSSDPHAKTGFPKLRHFHLSGCNLTEVEFLENLSCFPCLQDLNLSRNNFANLPTCEKLYDLDCLNISNCQQLQEIPKIPGKLRRVEATSCKSLSRIPSNISDAEIVHSYSCQELVHNRLPMNDWFNLEKAEDPGLVGYLKEQTYIK
ncbi:hypothetical protein BT93_L5822 [Corymbia citriodora subsp. variegata]|uniref:Disease resistance protein RPS4B/Roq1-like leucine-rich repeats domain-containing protein n=1 Tax=Corymbia citriodora subsp. variegata TaxID=360336 RepID=A0A8T0CR87_CORYI|nr:hypothetical protein BT93_L5822 [Corymbia citriodora subsp. variegata]